MTTFVDTSAIYALLDSGEPNHASAAAAFRELVGAEELITHSYVLVETTASVQHRLGTGAVDTLVNELLRPVAVVWVDAALTALLAAGHRRVSLVDWTSVEPMRNGGSPRRSPSTPTFAAHVCPSSPWGTDLRFCDCGTSVPAPNLCSAPTVSISVSRPS